MVLRLQVGVCLTRLSRYDAGLWLGCTCMNAIVRWKCPFLSRLNVILIISLGWTGMNLCGLVWSINVGDGVVLVLLFASMSLVSMLVNRMWVVLGRVLTLLMRMSAFLLHSLRRSELIFGLDWSSLHLTIIVLVAWVRPTPSTACRLGVQGVLACPVMMLLSLVFLKLVN